MGLTPTPGGQGAGRCWPDSAQCSLEMGPWWGGLGVALGLGPSAAGLPEEEATHQLCLKPPCSPGAGGSPPHILPCCDCNYPVDAPHFLLVSWGLALGTLAQRPHFQVSVTAWPGSVQTCSVPPALCLVFCGWLGRCHLVLLPSGRALSPAGEGLSVHKGPASATCSVDEL